MEKYMIVLVVLADLIIGNKRIKEYFAMMTNGIATALGMKLWDESEDASKQRKKGVVLVCATIMLSYISAIALAIALMMLGPWGYFLGSILIVSLLIMPRSLSESAYEVREALAEGNIVEARRRASDIIDCDTDMMGREELARAAVGTLAEKLVTKVISPLFYFMLGDFPLAFMYCVAHGASSLFPCQNEKYAEFGYAAAKMDEVLNYIPARITAMLMVAASSILRFDTRQAVAMIRRDADKYPGPNGGCTEAAMAGALNIRLGGTTCCNGKEVEREYIGDASEQVSEGHIDKAIRLLYTVVILFCLIGVVIKMMGGGV
jgi:adenosylcobinamide-phosphate synthase